MKKIKVVLLSEWLSNPYKQLLSEKLQTQGAEVKEYLWSNIFLLKVIRFWKPDILHLHTLHPFLRGSSELVKNIKLWLFVFQLFLLKSLGTKIVWTVHEWNDKLETTSGNISKKHSLILSKYIDAFIVHCESTKKVINDVFQMADENKVHTIYHGNYIEYYPNNIDRVTARHKLSIPNRNFVFLFFGGLYRSYKHF